MKTLFFSVLLFGWTNLCQSQDYTIQHFQSNYDTLVDFESLTKELIVEGEWPSFWERAFNFGFDFPFYGDTYAVLYLDNWAVGYFPESPEYNVYLFGANYVIGDILDTFNLDTKYLNSEIRYAYPTVNGVNAMVIEYHNVYVEEEYNENGPNHFINFQTWFYENGIIEVHFGPIDLDNCTHYYPGQGFSHVDHIEGEVYGPWLEINNFDFSKSAYFFGDHTDPDILYDDHLNAGVVTSIPPTGFVVQFFPSYLSSTKDVQHEPLNHFSVTQHDGTFVITDELGCFKSCELYDVVGRKIGKSNEVEFNTTSSLPQILFVYIKSDCGPEVHKVWMN